MGLFSHRGDYISLIHRCSSYPPRPPARVTGFCCLVENEREWRNTDNCDDFAGMRWSRPPSTAVPAFWLVSSCSQCWVTCHSSLARVSLTSHRMVSSSSLIFDGWTASSHEICLRFCGYLFARIVPFFFSECLRLFNHIQCCIIGKPTIVRFPRC